jgi:hypothetical protein
MILLFFCEYKNNKLVRMNTASSVASILLLSLATSQLVQADEARDLHPWLTSKYAFDIGVFFPDRSNKLRAGGSFEFDPEPTPLVDFNSELRLSQSDSTVAAEFHWWYGKRWSLLMQYFDSKGDNTAILEEDVEWDDLTFLAGTRASAGSGFELTRFFWAYNLSKKPNSDYGVGAGFHWLHINAYIEGTVEAPSGPASDGEKASVDAPLPNIGFWYLRSLSPGWAFRTRLDYFNADIHPYDGTFVNASLGLHYRVSEWFGVGASYNYIELDVGVDGDNWRGEIESRYDGIYVYLGAFW